MKKSKKNVENKKSESFAPLKRHLSENIESQSNEKVIFIKY